jgi:hypothetical protein
MPVVLVLGASLSGHVPAVEMPQSLTAKNF